MTKNINKELRRNGKGVLIFSDGDGFSVSWKRDATEMQMHLTPTADGLGYIRTGRQTQLNGHKPDDAIFGSQYISKACVLDYYGFEE